MHRPLILFALIICLTAPAAWAQESDSQDLSIQAGYGTVTMGGVQWQRFSLRPDIPIGKFGLGLDIELFIDSEGKLSDKGWDFSTRSKTWDTLLRKIYYVRYGRPIDRFYVRVGALDNVTLGYGLIMDGYRNTLNYPADKKLGVQFSARDVGTFGIDLEMMMNDAGDLRNKGGVVGARAGFRPLKPTDIPILGRLVIGVSAVRDINQFAGLMDSDDDGYPDFQDGYPDDSDRHADSDGDGFEDSVDIDADGDNVLDTFDTAVTTTDYIDINRKKNGVTMYGFDMGIPLVESPVRLDLYGQYAKMHTGDKGFDGGWGIGAPGLRLLAGNFRAQTEFRRFTGRFMPNYFDQLYEHERVYLVGANVITKESTLLDETLNGAWGMVGYSFFDMVSARATFQTMSGDRTYRDLTGSARAHENLLGLIPKLSIAEAYFSNRNVPKTGDLFKKTPTTFYGARIGMEVAPGMSIVWDTRYTFTPKAGGGVERNRFVSIETVMTVK